MLVPFTSLHVRTRHMLSKQQIKSDEGDFVGRDNGPIALVLENRNQRKVLSTGNKGRSKVL